jgi:hypothetical protein
MSKQEIVGKKFQYLTVLEKLPNGKVMCDCDCGTVRSFNLRDVKRGKTKGCGCRRNTPELRVLARQRALKLQNDGILNRGGDYQSNKDREFKYLLRKIKHGFNKRKPCSISIDDLKDVWTRQNGKCVYTNIELALPVSSSNPNPKISYLMASVDRIDSSKPYCKDNIQFVSRNINYAKNNLSHQQMVDFINMIKKYGGEGPNLKADLSASS